ncbi:bifunctional methionine sulfoxide reductase B/A protein [Shewanella sp. VB17]|uniref:bifunctional methionine sulfoxide reductase B/A protein n=1 Tax=Shewanella sp. VB17 TaxID=2739432 RepID=UPI00156668E1|nr:bifunctional methionine sulfoxide reductase B/A protein [Shewanella sp. VB17]NRD73705.1 bifunctional methionine sulfoxide reductase B/A protein [Shewanella sp. VB17]
MKILTDFERYVIEEKGTERPFSGEYNQFDAQGVYVCKRCDTPLYLSESKFIAHCGWPAFDDEISGAIKRSPDIDGRRVEITCAACDGHLGHVFEGEYLTEKNIRHCVNSVSLSFQPLEGMEAESRQQLATFGAGCFWCIEAIFSELNGVNEVRSGYSGADPDTANYEDVCTGLTGHAEVVQIHFNPDVISFNDLLEVFWMNHNPTTLNRQGADSGTQYRSVVFGHTSQQIDNANEMIEKLTLAQLWPDPIVTEVALFETFYPAENYHHNYFAQNGDAPYCQMVIKPKIEKFRDAFSQKLKAN